MRQLLGHGPGALMLNRALKRALLGQRQRKCSYCGKRHSGGAGAHGTPAQRRAEQAQTQAAVRAFDLKYGKFYFPVTLIAIVVLAGALMAHQPEPPVRSEMVTLEQVLSRPAFHDTTVTSAALVASAEREYDAALTPFDHPSRTDVNWTAARRRLQLAEAALRELRH